MDQKRVQLIEDVKSSIKNKLILNDILNTVVIKIDAFSDGYNWTGIYMMKEDHLEVGPYIGEETPHTHIELNQGICGAAVSNQRTIVVDDVNADPRFLACSIKTKSEIVVPLMDGENVLGEIDIDSNQLSFFTDDDKQMLEKIAEILVNRLKQIQ